MKDEFEYSQRSRPLGISLITVLFWIGGLFFLLGALAGGVGPALGALGNLGGLIIALLIALGAVALAIGYGLWKLQPWALWAAIILAGLDMATRLYATISVSTANPKDDLYSIINVGIMILENVIIVYLFLQRKVFEEEQTPIEH